MAEQACEIEVFVNEDGGTEAVALVLRNTSIVEFEGELVPGVAMTAWHARCLAHALNECATRIEGENESAA